MPRRLAAVVFLALLVAAHPRADDKPKEEWKKLFDGKSLTNWKSVEFRGEGKVAVKDGAILLPKGTKMTGVVYTKDDFPKMDYEVSYEAKKIDGDDFFAMATFPVGDAHCSFVPGGWRGSVTGISRVNGSDAVDNETNKSKEYKQGQWYRIRLRVTKARLEAWVDKDKMVDLDTTDVTLSLRLESRPLRPFGLASYDTDGAVRDIRVRALTDAEKKAGK